jgi:hypothetical protein
MTTQIRANIKKNTVLAGDTIAHFTCTGPIGATAQSEQFSCQSVLSDQYGQTQSISKSVTAYPDGSWISTAG